MRLNSLTLKNFRCVEDSTFQFHPEFNLLIGANGSGKTTILEAISCVVDNLVQRLADQPGGHGPFASDVRFGSVISGTRVRFEKFYPIELSVTASVFGQELTWSLVRRGDADFPDIDYSPSRFVNAKMSQFESTKPFVLPIVVCYGAHRTTKESRSSLEEAAVEQISRRSGYEGWMNALVSRTSLENWIIGKTLEHLQALAEISSGSQTSVGEPDELDIVNGAVTQCIPGAAGIKYDVRLRQLTFEFSEGSRVPFEGLSSGQQSMVTLVADIARRMCVLNPHLGSRVLEDTNGMVLIDEIDIHLHPSWQRRILKVLRSVFPKVQFFASSHSPQMVGGLSPGEVIIIDNGGLPVKPHYTYGLDASKVLEEVMDSDSRDQEIESLLGSILEKVEASDLDGAKKTLSNLRAKAPGLPEYVRLDALIRRKELIGK